MQKSFFQQKCENCKRICMKSCEISFEILKSNQNPEILIEILKSDQNLEISIEILGKKGRFQNLVSDFAWLLTPHSMQQSY